MHCYRDVWTIIKWLNARKIESEFIVKIYALCYSELYSNYETNVIKTKQNKTKNHFTKFMHFWGIYNMTICFKKVGFNILYFEEAKMC